MPDDNSVIAAIRETFADMQQDPTFRNVGLSLLSATITRKDPVEEYSGGCTIITVQARGPILSGDQAGKEFGGTNFKVFPLSVSRSLVEP